MASQNRTVLKGYFNTGDTPTEAQFADLIDSFHNPTNDGAVQIQPSEGAFVNGDKTKLDGIETAADVTDATNVAAAGAVMDGDFSANGFMRRTGAGTYDTDDQVLMADTTDQLTAGFTGAVYDGGTAGATYTPNPANGNFQKVLNDGSALEIAVPTIGTNDATSIILHVRNTANPSGAITVAAGYETPTGDSFTTTQNAEFLVYLDAFNDGTNTRATAIIKQVV